MSLREQVVAEGEEVWQKGRYSRTDQGQSNWLPEKINRLSKECAERMADRILAAVAEEVEGMPRLTDEEMLVIKSRIPLRKSDEELYEWIGKVMVILMDSSAKAERTNTVALLRKEG